MFLKMIVLTTIKYLYHLTYIHLFMDSFFFLFSLLLYNTHTQMSWAEPSVVALVALGGLFVVTGLVVACRAALAEQAEGGAGPVPAASNSADPMWLEGSGLEVVLDLCRSDLHGSAAAERQQRAEQGVGHAALARRGGANGAWARRGADILGLTAELVRFGDREGVAALVGCARGCLPLAEQGRAGQAAAEMAFAELARGLIANPSAGWPALLALSQGLVGAGLAAEEAAASEAEAALATVGLRGAAIPAAERLRRNDVAEVAAQTNRSGRANATGPSQKFEWLVTKFALGVLNAGFKKGGLDAGGKGGVQLHMLEPLGDLLARGCRSRHAPVTSLSLRCLARLALGAATSPSRSCRGPPRTLGIY